MAVFRTVEQSDNEQPGYQNREVLTWQITSIDANQEQKIQKFHREEQRARPGTDPYGKDR